MKIDNKKIRTHRFTWKILNGKNHENRRKKIHYVKNWYKGENRASTT